MKSAVSAAIPAHFERGPSRNSQASRLMLRKQLWIWPLAAAVVLSLVAVWVRRNVEATIKSAMSSDLQAVLAANVTALEIWIEMQKAIARTITQDPELEKYVTQLAALADSQDDPKRALLNSPLQDELGAALEPALREHKYASFILADTDGRILAGGNPELIGEPIPESQRRHFAGVDGGNTLVTHPMASVIPLADRRGQVRAGVPTMFAAAPVRNADDQVVAILALRIDPELDFTRILRTAHIGDTGETYAFDRQGVLLSESRFDETLKEIGLLPDQSDASSIVTVTLKDPGVDMTRGYRPALRKADQPLTEMAQNAIAGRSGLNVDGYRDYRGVPVIGAWLWLPDQNFGLATEMDVAEAFRPLYVLRLAFWSLFGLLALSAVAIFVFTVMLARIQRVARRAVLNARQLGQYSLDEKIGVGGMGVVYKGRHAMLRRPTAIKLLDIDKVTDAAVQRFEREVQLTCQLAHPNTIAIYDYGRTPEGVFYYAMEYLDGLTLEQLVDRYGPQCEGRVIQILAQVCGSLAEAHSLGLVHRDIKPANIVINRRGGVCDVVKVLDFGLVKAIDQTQQASLTAANTMAGTPLFMAPESINNPTTVGPAADLYAVGAVGYYLLTGTPLFSGESVVKICMQQVNDPPEPPSQRLGKPVSADLERILLRCLAKGAVDRPASARELADALLTCQSAGMWTPAMAEKWWQQHTPIAAGQTTIEAAQPTKTSDESLPAGFRNSTIEQRTL